MPPTFECPCSVWCLTPSIGCADSDSGSAEISAMLRRRDALTGGPDPSKSVPTEHNMTTELAAAETLFDLFRFIPAENTAVIVPEQNLRISYGSLRNQVEAVTASLAAAGVSRGDRVGIAVPNSLSTIVCFLAASMAGTAAPLNPA